MSFEWLGYSPEAAVFMGLIVALSSTAIVLKLLQEKGEIYSAHGRIALGILIFQDIAAVFIIILAPLLAGETGTENVHLRACVSGNWAYSSHSYKFPLCGSFSPVPGGENTQ